MKEDTAFVHELSNFRDWWRMQSVMSATDTLGHRDVRGLSATDPRPRQWITKCTYLNSANQQVYIAPRSKANSDKPVSSCS